MIREQVFQYFKCREISLVTRRGETRGTRVFALRTVMILDLVRACLHTSNHKLSFHLHISILQDNL